MPSTYVLAYVLGMQYFTIATYIDFKLVYIYKFSSMAQRLLVIAQAV